MSASGVPACGKVHHGTTDGKAFRRAERGAGHLGAIVWLLILGSFVYVCIKVVPILFSEYQFQDAMQTAARFASVTRQTPDQILKTMTEEAEKQSIDVKPEDIHVMTENGNIKISADYTVVVDLQVYQLTLNLHPKASNDKL